MSIYDSIACCGGEHSAFGPEASTRTPLPTPAGSFEAGNSIYTRLNAVYPNSEQIQGRRSIENVQPPSKISNHASPDSPLFVHLPTHAVPRPGPSQCHARNKRPRRSDKRATDPRPRCRPHQSPPFEQAKGSKCHLKAAAEQSEQACR